GMSGAVLERYDYDSFGKQTVLDTDWLTRTSSSFAFVYGLQTGRLDALTGLYNRRRREQSLTLGRWMTNDPLGIKLGPSNLYLFVKNNPSKLLDPMGLFTGDDNLRPPVKPQPGEEGPEVAVEPEGPGDLWISSSESTGSEKDSRDICKKNKAEVWE